MCFLVPGRIPCARVCWNVHGGGEGRQATGSDLYVWVGEGGKSVEVMQQRRNVCHCLDAGVGAAGGVAGASGHGSTRSKARAAPAAAAGSTSAAATTTAAGDEGTLGPVMTDDMAAALAATRPTGLLHEF